MVERIVAGLVDGEAVDHGAGVMLVVGRDVAVVGEPVAEELDDTSDRGVRRG